MQTNYELETRNAAVKSAIEAEVNTVSDGLTPDQKEEVVKIAVAFATSHAGQIPNIAGIANHVQSETRRQVAAQKKA